MTGLSENDWELLTLDELGELAWPYLPGKAIAPGTGERETWDDLVIPSRLRDAIARLNPQLPPAAVEDGCKEITSVTSQDPFAENKRMHGFLVSGVRSVTYTDSFGAEQNPTIRLIDFASAEANDFLVANQVTLKDRNRHCRFDLVLYVNGMPLAFIELKKAGSPHASVETAHAQLMNYRADFPLAFRFNMLCVATDGIFARYGTAFTALEHFAPWNVDEAGKPVDTQHATAFSGMALGVALHGLFEQTRFLDLLKGFVNFTPTTKRIAKPHQYFAVVKASRAIVKATREDGRAGVVWHTQGSGKSEEMVLAAARAMSDPALGNPTIVVVTDRLDLDNQLYETFLESEILPQQPKQIESREKLRDELANVRSGGILFTVLQKFGRTKLERETGQEHPLLSERRNIILMVDEAHRSHYDNLDGYARHIRGALPNATFIAFTGTPLSLAERNTRDVFGPYIDVYDLRRAVDDGATVRVYHESRLVELQPRGDLDALDQQAAKLTEGLSEQERIDAERAATTLDLVYGADDRIAKLAADLVEHWEKRRERMRGYLGGAPGKGMIVCVSRPVCVKLYDAIVALRPDWHSDAVDKGKIKIVFSGKAEDPAYLKKHLLRPSQSKAVQRRAKDENDELELLIVCDMLLTGYDAPPLHTMYLDRPLHGANLMQALARVNRRFMDKQDGLLVGYAPLTEKLHAALAEYSQRDQEDQTLGRDIQRAIDETRNHHDSICRMLSGIDWRGMLAARRKDAYIVTVLAVVNHVTEPATPGNRVEAGEDDLATRFAHESSKLERFYALCSARSKELHDIRDDITFFGEVRTWMRKFEAEDRIARGLPTPRGTEYLLQQLAEQAIEAGGIRSLYDEAGLGLPDLSHLDAAYIQKLQESATPHLHAEALRRLVQQEMRKVSRHNVVRQQMFSERLESVMNRYHNQQLTSAQVIAELIALAKDIHADESRGQHFSPPLNEYELAFYDAVAENESAVNVLGDGVLADIARELVEIVRRDAKVDWREREAVQAKLRSTIKRLLRKHGYPPDRQAAAVERVLAQVDTLAEEWSTV